MIYDPRRDLYSVLAADPMATADAIRAAYRRVARASHPDRNPRDPRATRRMQDVNKAYEVLSTPNSRAKYDATRNAYYRKRIAEISSQGQPRVRPVRARPQRPAARPARSAGRIQTRARAPAGPFTTIARAATKRMWHDNPFTAFLMLVGAGALDAYVEKERPRGG